MIACQYICKLVWLLIFEQEEVLFLIEELLIGQLVVGNLNRVVVLSAVKPAIFPRRLVQRQLTGVKIVLQVAEPEFVSVRFLHTCRLLVLIGPIYAADRVE